MPDSAPKKRPSLTWCLCRHGMGLCGCAIAYAFILFLVALIGVLVYLLSSKDIPVPRFLLNRLEARLAESGFKTTFGSIHFDPAGRILIEDMKLFYVASTEPVAKAHLVLIDVNLPKLIGGTFQARRLKISGGTIYSPAMLSPSGLSEPVLSDINLQLVEHASRWNVSQLVTRFGNLSVTAHGAIPVSAPTGPPPSIPEVIDRVVQMTPKLIKIRDQFQKTESPELAVTLSPAGSMTRIVGHLVTRDARIDPKTELNGIAATFTATASPEKSGPVRVDVTIDQANREGVGEIHHVRAYASWPRLPDARNPWPQLVEWQAADIQRGKVNINALSGSLSPASFPHVTGQVVFRLDSQPVSITFNADTHSGVADATISGSAGRTWLQTASTLAGRDLTYYASFSDEPEFRIHARIAKGWKPASADFALQSTGPIVVKGVKLDHVYLLGTLTHDELKVPVMELDHGPNHVSGSYHDMLATRDYRFLLKGKFRPRDISDWFHPWWRHFWKDFTFSGPAANCDLSIIGCWKAPHKTLVTGTAHAQSVSIKGVPFSRVGGRMFIRPQYFDIFDASAITPEGRADGEFQLTYEYGNHVPLQQNFAFTSSLDLKKAAAIFGENGVKMLVPYEYKTPPHVKALGTIHRSGDKFDTNIHLHIQTPHPFAYYHFPLENLNTDVTIHNGDIDLPNLRAGLGNSELTGQAHVRDDHLNFDVALKNADFDKTVAAVNQYFDYDKPKSQKENGTGLTRKKIGGRLDLTASATGPLTDFQAYEGKGTIDVRDAKLGEVNLFGLLSEVLRATPLKFSTLEFTKAHSNFEIKKSYIHFPNADVTGPIAAVKGEGNYTIKDGSLDFRAKLFPFSRSSMPLFAIIGTVLDPLSYVFELHLGGTLANPKWGLSLGGGTLKNPPAASSVAPAGQTLPPGAGTPAASSDVQAGSSRQPSGKSTPKPTDATSGKPTTKTAEPALK